MSNQPNVTDERQARGAALLRHIGGIGWDGPVKKLAETSAAFADFTITYPYGDVLSRPGLDLRLRQICTVASLMAQGSAQPQLRFHMEGLLNVGGAPSDLVELLALAAAILGFPSAINAVGIVRSIFHDRGVVCTVPESTDASAAERRAKGIHALEELLGLDVASYAAVWASIAPDFASWAIDFAFGDVLSRDGLEPSAKHMAIISMLATTGNRAEALKLHIRGALRSGASEEQLVEAIIQLSVYAGFPTAINAFTVAREVISGTGGPSQPRQPNAIPLPEGSANRRTRGLATLELTSGASGTAVVHSFDDLLPAIGEWIVDHSYGDIFSRPQLDPKIRELTACAALAGSLTAASETPLKVHITAALAVGATQREVVETLINVAPYRGYPAVQRALELARAVFHAA